MSINTDTEQIVGGKGDEEKKPEREDNVLNYPDGPTADSGNQRLSTEEEMKGMIIRQTAVRDDSDAPDPWELPELAGYQVKPWSERTTQEKIHTVVFAILKTVLVFLLFYVFVCSLDLLNVSLRLVAGRNTGKFIRDNPVITNPVGGVMIGLLVTVLVQSSSTSTSVIVSLVSADLLQVRSAIPLIMGANIGTSVTNTAVALTQIRDRRQFRRAFAGATVHDTFNMLTTVALLTLEVSLGYLEHLTQAMVDPISTNTTKFEKVEFLQVLTKPLVHKIVIIDSKIEACWRSENKNDSNCMKADPFLKQTSMICGANPGTCNRHHLFRGTSLSDISAGLLLFFLCVLVICICLVIVVKLLSSMLKGKIAQIIRNVVNYEFPSCPWITGYLAILVGLALTFLVQSSSVFTAALTPLVGIGVVSLEIMYPLTLGANIGTTTTAIIASFASASAGKEKAFKASLQIALCHLFFNISGILIFFPIPFMRWPIFLAKRLGKTSSRYRWFAVVYIIIGFFIIPGLLFAVSFAGVIVALLVLYILSVTLGVIVAINYLQDHYPNRLPRRLRDWEWLPEPMHSLEPYNSLILRCKCCKKLQAKNAPLSKYDSAITLVRASREKSGPKPSNISLISFPVNEFPIKNDADPVVDVEKDPQGPKRRVNSSGKDGPS